MKTSKRLQRIRRHGRVRAKIHGSKELPRVAVFRSNRHIHAQIIDDKSGTTLVSMHDIEKAATKKTTGKKTDRAAVVGEHLAAAAQKLGISKVVFDRGGHKYHGRVRALAEGLRKGGLNF